MNPDRLKEWVAELGVLAAEDEARQREAALRLHLAASELEAAQAHADVVAQMAASSRNAHEKVMEQIQRTHPGSGDAEAGPLPPQRQPEKVPHASGSVAGVILAFLRDRREASYSEITEQVRQMRPDVVAENCARDLGRMVGRGLLFRPRTGVYRVTATQDGPTSP